MPNPFGPIGDTLHHIRIGGTEQSQITDQERPDRLGVPNKHIIERQTQAIGLPLRIEDVDHQHAAPARVPKSRGGPGRLAAAVCTPGAHASAIKTDTDRLPASGPLEGTGRRRAASCGIAQTGARLSGAVVIRTRLDTSRLAAPAEHVGGFEIAGGLYHVQGDLRAAGGADPIGNAEALRTG